MEKSSILNRVKNYFLENSRNAKIVGIKTLKRDGSLDINALTESAIEKLPKTYYENNRINQKGYTNPIVLLSKEVSFSINKNENVKKNSLYLASRINVFKNRVEVTINDNKYDGKDFSFFDSKKKEEITNINSFVMERVYVQSDKKKNSMKASLVDSKTLKNNPESLNPTYYNYEYKEPGFENGYIVPIVVKKNDKFYRVDRINMRKSSSDVMFDGTVKPIKENSINYKYYNAYTLDEVDIYDLDDVKSLMIDNKETMKEKSVS